MRASHEYRLLVREWRALLQLRLPWSTQVQQEDRIVLLQRGISLTAAEADGVSDEDVRLATGLPCCQCFRSSCASPGCPR